MTANDTGYVLVEQRDGHAGRAFAPADRARGPPSSSPSRSRDRRRRPSAAAMFAAHLVAVRRDLRRLEEHGRVDRGDDETVLGRPSRATSRRMSMLDASFQRASRVREMRRRCRRGPPRRAARRRSRGTSTSASEWPARPGAARDRRRRRGRAAATRRTRGRRTRCPTLIARPPAAPRRRATSCGVVIFDVAVVARDDPHVDTEPLDERDVVRADRTRPRGRRSCARRYTSARNALRRLRRRRACDRSSVATMSPPSDLLDRVRQRDSAGHTASHSSSSRSTASNNDDGASARAASWTRNASVAGRRCERGRGRRLPRRAAGDDARPACVSPGGTATRRDRS